MLTSESREIFGEAEKAYAYAEAKGREETAARAREQGAEGELKITVERIHKEAEHRFGTSWLGDVLRFRATSES